MYIQRVEYDHVPNRHPAIKCNLGGDLIFKLQKKTLIFFLSFSFSFFPFAFFKEVLLFSFLKILKRASFSLGNMSQTPTTPISPTPLKTTFFNGNNVQESLISPTKEEISTIFVVGFPEDMQEREFQNMFMFSPGFEAATLKIPLTEEENNRKQIVSTAEIGWKISLNY